MQHRGQQQFDLGGSQEPRKDPARAPFGNLTPRKFEGLKQSEHSYDSDWDDVPVRGGPAHQLPMFMSQREITSRYQPLDADRQEVYDPREGEATGRTETTGGYPNRRISTSDRAAPWMVKQAAEDPSGVARATHYRDFGRPESHQEMMDRKLQESQMPHHEYLEHHQGSTSDEARTPDWEQMMEMTGAPQYKTDGTDDYDYAMDEHVTNMTAKHHERMNRSLYGDMHRAMEPGGEGFTGLVHLATGQFGSEGKPQIAGAHHRLAALGEIAPDRLLPVVHHEKMRDARWGESKALFPYT